MEKDCVKITDVEQEYELPEITKAKKYFERRMVDDNKLKLAIPELLRVIGDLFHIRNSERKTEAHIKEWREKKVERIQKRSLSSGEIVEVEINNPDVSERDRYTSWLFGYFNKLYEDRIGKTISYAFAFNELTVAYNQQILNHRAFGEMIDHPNTDLDDVIDAIEAEVEVIQNMSTKQFISEDDTTEVSENVDVIEEKDSRLKKYTIDNYKMSHVYDFGINTNVFGGCITLIDFFNCVQCADFSKIYQDRNTKKTKTKYIVYIISHYYNAEWYNAAASSIGTTPGKCSGANVSDDGGKWKTDANNLKPKTKI